MRRTVEDGRLDLTTVTLMACTGRDHRATALTIQRCIDVAKFRNVVVFTNDVGEFEPMPFNYDGYTEVTYIPAGPWENWEDLSVFGLIELPKYAHLYGEHCLGIHWDGFISNPDAWTDTFLEYDYIGAAWPDNVVGNNGFCLVSQRYWKSITMLGLEPTIEACHPSDALVCRDGWRHKTGYRGRLERFGVKFAPLEVARAFSVENEEVTTSFGFHGAYSLASAVRKGIVGSW